VDVAGSGATPFQHFVERGREEGRTPHLLFDSKWYLEKNPDVAAAALEPFRHFVEFGISEGRSAHPFFDSDWYLEANPDVAASGVPPLRHFIECGMEEGRNPHPLFDGAWYLEDNPDVAAAGEPPFRHFVERGMAEARNPHPLFDSKWYKARYPDVSQTLFPFDHFLRYGMHQGRNPHPLFDTAFYKSRYGDHPGKPPIIAFIEYGCVADRSPTPFFNTAWYYERYPDVVAFRTPAFLHFLLRGLAEGRSPLRLFDPAWYLRNNPTIIGPAFRHFLQHGNVEGRDPNPLFDTKWYRERYADQLGGFTAFEHYLHNGFLQPNRAFNPSYVDKQLSALVPRDVGRTGLSSVARPNKRDVRPSQAATTVFTSVALSRLPQALILAESLKKHSPSVYFVIVLCDDPGGLTIESLVDVDEVVPVRELVPNGFARWAFKHDLVELCAAAKGVALEALLARPGCEKVIYLDSDTMVFSDIEAIDLALVEHAVIITPQLLEPESKPAATEPNELNLLKHGIYNYGFLAVRNDDAGRRFAAWWRDRLHVHCFDEPSLGLFLDRKWMDLAPGLFPELGVLRHPGCSVSPSNIDTRRLEGNFHQGFTANGEPLIFAHFDARDGSANAISTATAAPSRAALLVQEIYAQRLAVKKTLLGEMPEWAFASYENGRVIEKAQRLLYRTRTDLQLIFADPFATRTEPSFMYWYDRTYDRTSNASHWRMAPLESGQTLLDGYLAHWRTDGLRPCAFFDPLFYLQAYPEVARAGLDPVRHFLDFGLHEARRPCQELDLRFYMSQTRATYPEQTFWTILESGVEPGVRPVPTYLPAWDNKLVERLRHALDNAKPTILMVSHYGGGGTSKHVQELTAALNGVVNPLLLVPGDGTMSLELPNTSIPPLLFGARELNDTLVKLLTQLNIVRAHIHHAQGFNERLQPFLNRLHVPYDVTLHDTYFLAPNPMFLHSSDARSRPGLEAEMLAAMTQPIDGPLPEGMSLCDWREQFASLLRGADRLICPTNSLAGIYRAFYPELRPIVVPHLEISRPGLPLKLPMLGPRDPMTIAVLGVVAEHKGSWLLTECAIQARLRDLPFRFVVIGTGSDLLKSAGVTVTGSYDDESLPHLLRRHQVTALWFPFLAPESYSYTLTVGLWSGLPLFATDVGCLPERLADVPQAFVQPVETTPDVWLELFGRVRRDIVAGALVSKAVPPAPDTFYHTRYLDPILDISERSGPQLYTWNDALHEDQSFPAPAFPTWGQKRSPAV
jgi:glycosyltransferase involved in cell wall biosynthesis